MKIIFKHIIKIFLLVIIYLAASCSINKNDIISKSITKIKSLDKYYYLSDVAYGDPNQSESTKRLRYYIKAISDFSDSIIGAKFIYFENDTTTPLINYQNNTLYNYSIKKKTVEIKKLKSDNPFLMAPIPIKALSIFNYYLKNQDSSVLHMTEEGSDIKLAFTFRNRDIYFANLLPFITIKPNVTSLVVVWLNADLVPFKLENHLPTLLETESIKYLKPIITKNDLEYLTDNYRPKEYSIEQNSSDVLLQELNKHLNSIIVSEELKNISGGTINIGTLGTPTLIEFTSASCGACKQAIPFLNTFNKENKSRGIKIISIESFPYSKEFLSNYVQSSKIEYDYFLPNDELLLHYRIPGYPTFFVIDKRGIIRKIILGYSKDDTNKEIIMAFKNL